MVQISSIGNNLGQQRRQQQRPHRHHCTSSGIASCVEWMARRAATRKTRAFLRFYIYSSPYYTQVTLHPVRIVIAACPSNLWFAYSLLGCRYPLLLHLHLLLLPQLWPIFDLTPPHNNTTTTFDLHRPFRFAAILSAKPVYLLQFGWPYPMDGPSTSSSSSVL